MAESGVESSTEAAGPGEEAVGLPSTDADGAEEPTVHSESADATPLAEHPDLLDAIARFDQRLGESQRLLDRQLDLADRLHGENQVLRAGELRSAQLPLVRDLLRLHDDLGRMRDSVEDDGDLRIVQHSLADTLARNGVVAFEPDRGEEFDSRAHSAAGVEDTVEEGLNRTVAAVVKQGFRWESGEVIRVAEVTAYRYQEPS